MAAQTVTVTPKRVIAITLKYCEIDKNDPMLDLGQKVIVFFYASSTEMPMRVAGVDEIIENGDTKKLYHLISSDIVTQEEKTNSCRRALRKKLNRDVTKSEDEMAKTRRLSR
jgi:hypothetical protein